MKKTIKPSYTIKEMIKTWESDIRGWQHDLMLIKEGFYKAPGLDPVEKMRDKREAITLAKAELRAIKQRKFYNLFIQDIVDLPHEKRKIFSKEQKRRLGL